MAKKNGLYNSIILMGPRGVGKTAIADILARKFGIKNLNVDHYIRNNIDVDRETTYVENPLDADFIVSDVISLEETKIVFLRELLKIFSKKMVLDFSSPFGVFQNKEYLKEAKEILSLFNNKFLLIPSPDIEESLRMLCSRREDLAHQNCRTPIREDYVKLRSEVINRYFLTSPDCFGYNANIIYTKNKGPLVIADEISRIIK